MPASAASAPSAPSDLAWRVIGLLNLYRLLVPIVLITMEELAGPQWGLFVPRPALFLSACIAYFTAAVLLIIARRLEWSSLRIVTLLNAVVDAAAIALILYASGGVASGLGILLALPVFSMAVLADPRDAVLIATVAALSVLAQQVFVGMSETAPSTDYTTAGVLGVILFAISLAAWPVANRLRESEALVRRQELDLADLAHLSQYIVQHLRESILVIDSQDRIRLINESAAEILGDEHAYPDALLGEASPRLLYLLETWRQSAGGAGAFPAGEETRQERLSLQAWTEEFQEEFCDTMQWPRGRLGASGPPADVEVRADPSQLRQIVWNLCENALKHAVQDSPDQIVELRYGRMVPNARPFLEVADRGPGVPAEHAERIFEPFFSGGRGTGLGLFLAPELAQTNGATLLYV